MSIPPPAARGGWSRTAVRNLRRRWVQLLLVFVGFGAAFATSGALLSPPPDKSRPAAEKEYQYLHCDQCKMEIPYNPDLAEKPCPKCQPPKAGFFRPTRTSVKEGGDPSPWRWYNLALAVESLATGGAVVYLL